MQISQEIYLRCCSEPLNLGDLGFFLFFVFVREWGEGQGIYLHLSSSVKGKLAPRGHYKRGTSRWTSLGSFSRGKALAAFGLLAAVVLCPRAEASKTWRGLSPPGEVVFRRFGVRFRHLVFTSVLGDSWELENHCSTGLWNCKQCGCCILSTGSLLGGRGSFLDCFSYPQIIQSYTYFL